MIVLWINRTLSTSTLLTKLNLLITGGIIYIISTEQGFQYTWYSQVIKEFSVSPLSHS